MLNSAALLKGCLDCLASHSEDALCDAPPSVLPDISPADALIAEASRLWQAGIRRRVIAARLGVSENWMKAACKRRRDLFPARLVVVNTRAAKPRNPELVARCRSAWEAGQSVAQVCAAEGITPGSFSNMRCLHSFAKRARGANFCALNVARRTPHALRDAAAALWAEGLTGREIAARLGIKLSAVRYWAGRFRVLFAPRQTARLKNDPALIDALAADWAEGFTISGLMARRHMSHAAVAGIIKNNRARFARRLNAVREEAMRAGVLSEADVKMAAALWKTGMSQRQVAEHFGVTSNVIAGLANRDRAAFPKKFLQRTVKKAPAAPGGKVMRLSRKLAEGPARDDLSNVTRLFKDAPEPLNLALEDLTRFTCSWPVNEWEPGRAADARFCGAATGGNSYCGFHAQKSRVSPSAPSTRRYEKRRLSLRTGM